MVRNINKQLKGNVTDQTVIKTLAIEENMKKSFIRCKHCERFVKAQLDTSYNPEDFSKEEWESVQSDREIELTCSKCGNSEYFKYIGMKHVNQTSKHYKIVWIDAKNHDDEMTIENFERITNLTHSSKFPILA